MSASPEETLRAYVRAFESLDPDAVVPFYRLPCTFVAPHGVSVVSDAEAARALAGALVAHARSQGYRRTEIVGLETRRLAESIASLSGTFVRHRADDAEIGRFGFTYTMWRSGEEWKIVVAMAHDAPPAERGTP